MTYQEGRWLRSFAKLETVGKLGRVYSYWNARRKRRVYLHILSAYAARINERLALTRANQPKPGGMINWCVALDCPL